MIYPVAKTKEEFNKLWYDAQGFGAKTSYGYHEGNDLNLRTGGNTDLGKDLYAVGDGTIVYYHNASHPTTGFGRHMVLEVDTNKGKRWFHYSHCDVITSKVTKVKMGDVIGKLGKSGTEYAHLHFSCFKVDPTSLSKGIDTIATNLTDLNKNWIDPIKFIDEYVEPTPVPPTSPCSELQAKFNELEVKYTLERKRWAERDVEWDKKNDRIKELEDTMEVVRQNSFTEGVRKGRDSEFDRITKQLGILEIAEPKEDFDFAKWKSQQLGSTQSSFISKLISWLTSQKE